MYQLRQSSNDLIESQLFLFLFKCYGTHLYLHFSLHDALPISLGQSFAERLLTRGGDFIWQRLCHIGEHEDRKSTRLNSSHTVISYAVFCLKKKKKYLIDYSI